MLFTTKTFISNMILLNNSIAMFSTAGCTGGDIPIVLECLDVMVNKRKRQVRIKLDWFPLFIKLFTITHIRIGIHYLISSRVSYSTFPNGPTSKMLHLSLCIGALFEHFSKAQLNEIQNVSQKVTLHCPYLLPMAVNDYDLFKYNENCFWAFLG